MVGTSDHLKTDISPAHHTLVVMVIKCGSIFKIFDDNGDIVIAVSGRGGVNEANIFTVGKQEPRM